MTIHRRTLLKSSIPALVGSITLGAVADPGTPMQRLYSRWREAKATYERLASESEAQIERNTVAGNSNARQIDRDHEANFLDPTYIAMVELEDKIMALEIDDPRDLAIKVVIALQFEGAHDTDQYRRLQADALSLLA